MADVIAGTENERVIIALSRDAAEALMTVMERLTFQGNDEINTEFEQVWDGLADEFASESPYASKRFEFKADETLVFDCAD
jgi:hypothetical protein